MGQIQFAAVIFYFLLAKVRKPWQSGQYTVYLWEFLYGLLQDPECSSLITWTNKESREFRINNAHEIATLWGAVKNRPTMNDKKLLRALRYYYKTKVLRKVRKKILNDQLNCVNFCLLMCASYSASIPRSLLFVTLTVLHNVSPLVVGGGGGGREGGREGGKEGGREGGREGRGDRGE